MEDENGIKPKEAILKALEETGEAMTPLEMAEREGVKKGSVRSAAIRMYNKGELRKLDRGLYKLPLSATSTTEPVEVPRYGLVSAGPGAAPDIEPVENIITDGKEYRRLFGYRKVKRVGFFEVRGDSASPYYMDGERVPVEIVGPTQEFDDERIYVFRWRDDLRLKRLVKMDDHRVRMVSLNTGISPRLIEPYGDHDFVIWGEVLLPPKQEWFNSLVNRLRIDPQGLF